MQQSFSRTQFCSYCSHCTVNQVSEKEFSISRLPQYLLVAVNRFHFNANTEQTNKIKTRVEYPLTGLVIPLKETYDSPTNISYNLLAVVVL